MKHKQVVEEFKRVSNGSSASIEISQGDGIIDIENYHFSQNFDHHQSPIVDNPCYNFNYRVFIVILTVLVTVIGEILTIPSDQIECIYDPGHSWTDPINKAIRQNHILASALQIISSLILDISFLSICVYWLLYTRTFRFFFALLSFYAIRFIHLQLLNLKFAEGYYWDDPGVPSIVVKYGWLSDFFYSGHCGFLFLCSLEWGKIGQQKLSYLLLLCSFYQAFVVVSFRIHYTIDVPGGFVYAHWIYRIASDYEVQIDHQNKKCINFVKGIFCKKVEFDISVMPKESGDNDENKSIRKSV